MTKKELIDDTLEYYGLTEQDIEDIKNEKTYISEEVEKFLYMRDVFARQGIYIDDFDKFEKILESLETYNEFKNV